MRPREIESIDTPLPITIHYCRNSSNALIILYIKLGLNPIELYRNIDKTLFHPYFSNTDNTKIGMKVDNFYRKKNEEISG